MNKKRPRCTRKSATINILLIISILLQTTHADNTCYYKFVEMSGIEPTGVVSIKTGTDVDGCKMACLDGARDCAGVFLDENGECWATQTCQNDFINNENATYYQLDHDCDDNCGPVDWFMIEGFKMDTYTSPSYVEPGSVRSVDDAKAAVNLGEGVAFQVQLADNFTRLVIDCRFAPWPDDGYVYYSIVHNLCPLYFRCNKCVTGSSTVINPTTVETTFEPTTLESSSIMDTTFEITTVEPSTNVETTFEPTTIEETAIEITSDSSTFKSTDKETTFRPTTLESTSRELQNLATTDPTTVESIGSVFTVDTSQTISQPSIEESTASSLTIFTTKNLEETDKSMTDLFSKQSTNEDPTSIASLTTYSKATEHHSSSDITILDVTTVKVTNSRSEIITESCPECNTVALRTSNEKHSTERSTSLHLLSQSSNQNIQSISVTDQLITNLTELITLDIENISLVNYTREELSTGITISEKSSRSGFLWWIIVLILVIVVATASMIICYCCCFELMSTESDVMVQRSFLRPTRVIRVRRPRVRRRIIIIRRRRGLRILPLKIFLPIWPRYHLRFYPAYRSHPVIYLPRY